MHKCKGLVIHCMDFRFGDSLAEFLRTEKLLGDADIVGWAGAGKAFLDPESKDFALRQVELSRKLHGMEEVHVIQHVDCGAYGGSTTFEDTTTEEAFQKAQITEVRAVITEKFPDIRVFGYFAHKNGNGIHYTPVNE